MTTRKKLSDLSISPERAKELAQVRDEDIDFGEIPELDEAWFKSAQVRMPENKERLTVRFDKDIVEFFQEQGKGYQTRMNAVLRAYVNAHRKDGRA
jgi:uncharacterized protein (DUF4415 family)